MNTKENKKDETFKVIGNWDKQAKKLKAEFPKLTDADLKFETGEENELLDRLESKLHKNREEVIAILKKGQLEKV